MKIRLLLALVGLATSFALPTFAQEKNAVAPEVRQQIEAVFTQFQEVYNKHDAAAMGELHAQNAVEVRSLARDCFRSGCHPEKVCIRLCIESWQDGQRARSGVRYRQGHLRDI